MLRSLAHQIRAFRLSGAVSVAQERELLQNIGSVIVGIGVARSLRARHALLAAARDDVFADVAVLRDLLTAP